MRTIDPGRMSQDDILAELGELLAAGVQRHITSSMCHADEGANPPNPLAVSSAVEAPCGDPNQETQT